MIKVVTDNRIDLTTMSRVREIVVPPSYESVYYLSFSFDAPLPLLDHSPPLPSRRPLSLSRHNLSICSFISSVDGEVKTRERMREERRGSMQWFTILVSPWYLIPPSLLPSFPLFLFVSPSVSDSFNTVESKQIEEE